jgi:Sec-independent protein translocase protein TatA
VEVFAVLAVALALMCLGLAVVAARRLKQQAQSLGKAVERVNGRLKPLTDELQSELAVTSTELEHLQRQAEERRRAGRTHPGPIHSA